MDFVWIVAARGVWNRNTDITFKAGVPVEVTKEQAEILLKNPVFTESGKPTIKKEKKSKGKSFPSVEEVDRLREHAKENANPMLKED